MGDSEKVLSRIPSNSINLVITSPPFGLLRQKEYGNVDSSSYGKWFSPFAREIRRILVPNGSFVLHIGSSWKKGEPIKDLYQYRLLLHLCDDLGFNMAQEVFAYNPAKLPGPAQWVTVNRKRLKDSVDLIWWLSKNTDPKSDNRRVLKTYSSKMKKLLDDPDYYEPNVTRPSGHTISDNFWKDNGGAIPPNAFNLPNAIAWGDNWLSVSNTSSRDAYRDGCDFLGLKTNPARYPSFIPYFFIRFLTEPGDVILDPFAGSNVTGYAAETLERNWIAIEKSEVYLNGSIVRFLEVPSLRAKTSNVVEKMRRKPASYRIRCDSEARLWNGKARSGRSRRPVGA